MSFEKKLLKVIVRGQRLSHRFFDWIDYTEREMVYLRRENRALQVELGKMQKRLLK